MKIFKLPDLGEGLPDAIIREWYIKAGDQIEKDQPMVAMETAKALVDVPAPFSGKIEKLFGNANDTVETGHALIGFEGEADLSDIKKDTGTVVGKIEQSEQVISELNISDNKINIQIDRSLFCRCPCSIISLTRINNVGINVGGNGAA